MRLHVKTLLLVGATMLVVEAVVFSVAQRVIRGSFGDLERHHVEVTTQRARNVVLRRADRINMALSDWSAWDSSYQFVLDANEDFIRENLIPESFVRLDVDILCFINTAGTPVFAKMLAPDKQSFAEVPASLLSHFEAGGSLALASHDAAPRWGILTLPQGLLMLGVHPILHSDGGGPPAGSLIFAQWVDESMLEMFSDTTLAEVSLTPIGAGSLSSERAIVTPLSEKSIRGALACTDIFGIPTVRLDVTTTREVHQQGTRTTKLLLIVMGGITFAYGATLSALLSGIVLRRVRGLCNQASSVAASGQGTRRVCIGGNDELSELADRINEMLESIDRSRQSAEAASRAKTDFLANMSHEIRTPMTAILGYADLLVDPTQSSEDRAEAVKTIRRNGEHLLAVINDILDVSKIEAGRMTTESISASPLELARDVYSMMLPRTIEKGIRLVLEAVYPLPATIRTDPLRLRQILVNLVGNATKFTDVGSVTLRVSFEPGVDARMRFDVIDTGIGITGEQVEKIFAPFWQADNSTVRIFGGTGLGLSISRRLACMLGGDITVESSRGHGSTFSLQIATGDLTGVELISEVANAGHAEASAAQDRSQASERSLVGVKVLLVEDGRDNQRLITFHLRRAGAVVTCASDGAAGVSAFRDAERDGNPFRLILMDMQMPVLDGYGATAELRRIGCKLPIIALTAHAMSGDRQKCLAAGCDEFLTKPIDADQLIYACRMYARAPQTAAESRGAR